jgi:DNA excision repair protein ERCC-2
MLEKAGKGIGDLLLVVDEAHNLPDRIRANLSLELTAYGLSEAVREAGGTGLRGYRYTRALKKALDGWAGKLPENGEEYFEKTRLEDELEKAFSEVLGDKDTLEAYVKWLRDLGGSALKSGAERSFALELGDFVDKWASTGRGVARILSRGAGNSWTLRIAFLEVETAAGPVLAGAGAAVLMSGTLCPPGMYADILGVPEGKRMERIYESPFPKENRKVLSLRGITTQYARRDETMYGDYADRLAALAGAVAGNVAVFFPSYKFMEDVAAKLDNRFSKKELIVESRSMTKRDRENVVGRLRDGKPACLMLAVQGGGLSEGMDYEGNILSAIAVVGLPLAPPNLEVRALIGHFASVFGGERGNLYGYIAPALNRVVQSAGRLIRSEKDRGVVVLMDERFAQARYAALLPPEMRPEMLGSPDELIAEVKRFFAMR